MAERDTLEIQLLGAMLASGQAAPFKARLDAKLESGIVDAFGHNLSASIVHHAAVRKPRLRKLPALKR